MYRIIRSNALRASGMLLAAALAVAPGLAAQTGTVAGRITDAQTGQTVAAAQVFIADLDIGVLSQQNGSFLLLNVPAGTQTVTVQRIGYRVDTQQVMVTSGETTVVDFRISEEALQLDEIVITGTPGGTQKRAIGNTVTQVEVGSITQDVAITNMQDLLSGRTPGLQFTRLSGNVGAGSPIKIRGVGSFNLSANPLIYVDGVRVNNNARAGPTLGTAFGSLDDEQGAGNVSVLDDFNPEDIESIEIIKGPAAATLYGTEASAGVIQIITKKGNEGAPQFNLSVRQGTNFMTNPAGRLGQQYTCASDPAPGPTDCQTLESLTPYNMYDEANEYIANGTIPWPTDNLFQNGHAQGYNLDVRGGTQTVRYFLSANYEEEEGAVYYNKDETFRLRGNVGIVFSENVTLDVSTGYTDGYTRFGAATISDGGLWQDLIWSNGYYLERLNPGANDRLKGFQEHLPTDVADTEATRDYSRFTGSATLNLTVGDWLTQRAVVGLDKGWDTNRNLFPLEELGPSEAVYSETIEGEITYARPVTTNFSLDYAVTARANVGTAWGFATSAGAQYYTETFDNFTNTGRGFASPLSRTINQTALDRLTLGYQLIENKSLGFYVQEEINFNERIFVTAAIRFDDNSAFGADFSAERYPKLAATWVMSEESFWSFDAINSFRLRGAWGKAGRQPDAFASSNIYTVIPGPGGSAAIVPQSPGNPEVGPEVSTEIEAGFDAALLDDRISAEFTYFSQQNKDALLGVAIPASFGFPGSVDQNVGQIDNWGWEATVSTRIYQSDALSFDMDFSADHTDNEIKSLGDLEASRGLAVGLPYPNQTTDDWVASAQFDPSAPSTFSNAFGQNISALCDMGVSLAPDGAENPDQYGRVPGGEMVDCATITEQNLLVGPAFATYTFSVAPRISLMENQLQIFAMAEGQYGRWSQENGKEWGHIYNNTAVARLENDPVWVVADRLGDDLGKELYDASFWKLREIGLRYSLPQQFVQATGADRASIAVSGRNLWTIWRAQEEIYGGKVADPEYGTPTIAGSDNYWEMPPLSSVNVTLRVSF